MFLKKNLLSEIMLFLFIVCLYIATTSRLNQCPRDKPINEFTVSLSAPVQVGMSGGDPYLAANLAMLISARIDITQMSSESYTVFGAMQVAASRLDPYQEDNYYVSQAVLPWQGHLPETQYILERASTARYWDFYPDFFRSFNYAYFLHDQKMAGDAATRAAQHSPEGGNKQALYALAAKYYERIDDTKIAITSIKLIKAGTRDPALRNYLDQRIERLTGLAILRDAAKQFNIRQNRPPNTLQELTSSGILREIPLDPFGYGYDITSNHTIILVKPTAKRAKE